MGLLAAGLGEAVRAGVDVAGVRPLAVDVSERLCALQHAVTGLFPFQRRLRRKNFVRARADGSLGSFASQVYPTMGLALLARATGDERSLAAAARCAQRMCALQGPQGQWWWVYHTARAEPAVRYPVYSVHQDAMGPMALLAVGIAAGDKGRHESAILRSLDWFDARTECAQSGLIDVPSGVVWRAVQRDDPAHTDRLGLGRGELTRMACSALLGFADRRPFATGHVCFEYRPYHLGWILLAAGMVSGS